MADTVILGSGVIGLSTAYYLLQHQPGSTIHLVDSANELFASASGSAGGFLARDWFRPELAALGALSFEEHRRLAEEENGRENWGYAKSVTLSYEPDGPLMGGKRGEDWLLEGTSRAGLVDARREEHREGEVPAWLRRAEGDAVRVVDDGSGTAIVDPLRFCKFLLEKVKAAGVRIHNPAVATRLETDAAGKLSGVAVSHPEGGDDDDDEETVIPAARVLLAAGCWTPHVFHDLFKNRYYIDIPIESLGGHSLVVKAPAPPSGEEESTAACHSVYTTMGALSPEVYSRPDGVIYVAGVNHASIPLPKPRVKAVTFDESIQKLKDIARRLIATPEGQDLEVVREALCFRPITKRGTPYIARLPEDKLGEDFTTAGGDGAEGGSGGGVFIAAGHGPWGISLSLGTGKVMAEMMSGKPLSADISSLGF
ncbi:nucleotide-binding domain-containing protein [Trichoderma longibrachiatum]|uniref:Nucleotide-binding domain-containing protein n=1 Tax=Trichoderma longibrachiatum ATCC 18648 TaxID=983965 RepID=A0A2T4C5G6_TRILO|nr:nucleotide-binding domain-containing protein [Trichoderma longibrachiatum ATCC 18648]